MRNDPNRALFHNLNIESLEQRMFLAGAPFVIGGDPSVNPAQFRITTFANVQHPYGMQQLSDGSLLVGVSTGNYFSDPGELIRLVDANHDGIADGPGTVLAANLPPRLTSIRQAGNLVFVSDATGITILRKGATEADPYTTVGQLALTFPAGWSHESYSLEVRPTPGEPGETDLFFNVGSEQNAVGTPSNVTVGIAMGSFSGTVEGDSIYKVTVQDTGTAVNVSGLQEIAAGVRNAAGMALNPSTGDLYFEDNGINGPNNTDVSVDELNVLPAAQIGVTVPDYGFSHDYIVYGGSRTGSGAVQPLVAFQPLPGQSVGAAEIALSPAGFPSAFANGVFVGFQGNNANTPDQKNSVDFANPATGKYFQLIASGQTGVGHIDGLLSTSNSLFLADLTPSDDYSATGGGAIYQIQAISGGVTKGPAAIDAGGPAAGSFSADADFSGGNTFTTTAAIDTANVTNPAPQAVYQTERYGNFTYTLGGFTPGASYAVRLQFAENYWTAAGQRLFNVSMNGAQVLSSYDIFKDAGGKNIAVAKTFNATADANGQIAIVFTGVKDNAKVSSIEITSGAALPSADLQITNTDGASSVAPGATDSYKIVVSNAGSAEVTGAAVKDSLPAAFTNATYTAVPSGGATGFSASGSGNISDSAVNLPSGSSVTYTVTGTVSPTATGTLANTATVTAPATVSDPNRLNNTATDFDAVTTSGTVTTLTYIDAGGPASGSFVADTGFSGGSTFASSNSINTSLVASPAPQNVYQTERYGNFTYTLANLTAGSSHTVTLSFSENYWTAAGQRLFNVAINGTSVLSNFDIFAAAGGEFRAINETFNAIADSNGKLTITFTSVKDNAKVDAIAIDAVSTPPVSDAQINAGGPAVGTFAGDEDFTGGATYSNATMVNTANVSAPPPQQVFQTERNGNFTYVVPGLTAGASFTVRLDFAELYWNAVNQRLFNVTINGVAMLTNYDIFLAAGGKFTAIAPSFNTTADANGKITIAFTSVKDRAKVDGIEITPTEGF